MLVFPFSTISLTIHNNKIPSLTKNPILHPNSMPNYFIFSTSFLIIIIFCFNGSSTMAAVSPSGGGFATGVFDLGGLLIRQVSSFDQIWASSDGGGPNNSGATFYEPSSNSSPEGFFPLGSYVKSNNVQFSDDYVVVAKDVTNGCILKPPIDFTLVWSSNFNVSKIGNGHIWLPVAPNGYNSVGYVVTNSSEKPSPEKFRCVRSEYTDVAVADTWVWGPGDGFNVYGSRPRSHDKAILTGTFVAHNGGPGSSAPILASLKNVNGKLSTMPSLDQIKSLVQTYSPVIYFHPDEQFLPSGVEWFFQNGALLYHKGDESNPSRIDPTGSNLPQGGQNDEKYWLDLPIDGSGSASDTVKKGDLHNAGGYLHAKSINGGTFTDIAIWVFYPFNGGARAKVKFMNIGLGKIGEHVGDWEHVTLRINNFNGKLSSVFFSQHSGGQWVDPSQIEYYDGSKKPVVYASLHGHAAYPHAGLVLIGGGGGVGVRDDTAKSKYMMDTGVNYVVVAVEYLGSEVVEPPWLNYARAWGPKVDYDLDNEIKKVEKYLPGALKKVFEKLVRGIPPEVLYEDGPTGPKMKVSWSGDERGWA